MLATPATRKWRVSWASTCAAFGTGPAARITSEDVRPTRRGGAPAGPPPDPPSCAIPSALPFRACGGASPRTCRARSTRRLPYVEEVDAPSWSRCATGERHLGPRAASLFPFIVKATHALQVPQLIALDEAAGEIAQAHPYPRRHRGPIVPSCARRRHASVAELGREIDRLAEATRTSKASREDLSGSSFTITSLGQLGGVLAAPIINHPEVAILGVHKITKRPAVRDGAIVIRDLMNLSISVDHRVVDGHDAARFVAAIKEGLEAPKGLWQEPETKNLGQEKV